MDPTTITAMAGAVVLVIGAVVTGAVKIINVIVELKTATAITYEELKYNSDKTDQAIIATYNNRREIAKTHDTIREVKQEVTNGYVSSLEHTVLELRREITLLRLSLRGASDEEGI